MTRDEIIELTRSVGGYDGFTSIPSDWDNGDFVISPDQLCRLTEEIAKRAAAVTMIVWDFDGPRSS